LNIGDEPEFTKFEVAIVEVSGPFGNKDNARVVKNHVKVGYDVVALLHEIGHAFKYGDWEIMKTIRVFFVHFKGKYDRDINLNIQKRHNNIFLYRYLY
jgi:hypothetical protein